jgi:Right handed beta helix region
MSLRYISLAISLIAVCAVAPAQAVTHFVASTGTDSGSCIRTAPCARISQALSNAQPNDTIVCVDAVAESSLLIQKSIDIDCSGGRAVFREGTAAFGSVGGAICISIAVSASDPFRTVRLRGISILGASSTFRGVPRGIEILSAAVVSLENVVVSDVAQQGIFDGRTGGQTRLYITDSIIRNNGGPGVAIGAQGPTGTVLDNVRLEQNGYGIAVAAGNNVAISRSVISGNSTAGVEGDVGAQIIVDQSTISHNNLGVQSALSVRLSNNNIAFNNVAISGASGTFGNNRFSGNSSVGTAPTPLGGATSDVGQQ